MGFGLLPNATPNPEHPSPAKTIYYFSRLFKFTWHIYQVEVRMHKLRSVHLLKVINVVSSRVTELSFRVTELSFRSNWAILSDYLKYDITTTRHHNHDIQHPTHLSWHYITTATYNSDCDIPPPSDKIISDKMKFSGGGGSFLHIYLHIYLLYR